MLDFTPPDWETTQARLQLAVDMLADNLSVEFEKQIDPVDGAVMYHCHLNDELIMVVSALADDPPTHRPITLAAHLAYGHNGDVLKHFPSFLIASPTTDYITDTVVEYGRIVERELA